MKYTVEIEVEDKNLPFVEAFFNSISFVKRVKSITKNEVTNKSILASINDYESKRVVPTPFNLKELKGMIDA